MKKKFIPYSGILRSTLLIIIFQMSGFEAILNLNENDKEKAREELREDNVENAISNLRDRSVTYKLIGSYL